MSQAESNKPLGDHQRAQTYPAARVTGGGLQVQKLTPASQSCISRDFQTPTRQDSVLKNLIINILLPVFVLNWMSGHGSKPWHLGPVWGIAIAMAIPLAYGVWFLKLTRRANALSIAGMVSVLITGCITWSVWRPDGSIDESLFTLLAVKECLLPTIIGAWMLFSHWTPAPFMRLFIYNNQFFDTPRINKALDAVGKIEDFEITLRNASLVFASAFILSGAIIFWLTIHYLGEVDASAPSARELYNKALSKQMLMAFVILTCQFIFLTFFIILWLLNRLQHLTRLKRSCLMTFR